VTRPAVRRSLFGAFATIGVASCAALMIPLASADPESEPAPAPADNCNTSQLAKTVSGVTASLSDYFAAHPDVNQALIDITRQPAFVAVGQFDSYFGEHPQGGRRTAGDPAAPGRLQEQLRHAGVADRRADGARRRLRPDAEPA
jgi:heme-binding protein